jgi:hypothetical protein
MRKKIIKKYFLSHYLNQENCVYLYCPKGTATPTRMQKGQALQHLASAHRLLQQPLLGEALSKPHSHHKIT